jgi:cAMP-specific phosphodiesterase 4
VVELAILGIFVVEISLNIYAYQMFYLNDKWNLLDFIIIIISIVFVVLEMEMEDSSLSGLFRIRGIFRLLRLFLLIRKLNELKKKRDAIKRKVNAEVSMSSAAEKIIEILNDLLDRMPDDEDKLLEEINFCIKSIRAGKIYEE